MNKALKSKIHEMVEGIQDDLVLSQVMEEVAFYASKKDIVDTLNEEQLNELDKAIEEADNKDVIAWADLKKEMNEWKGN